MFSGRHDPDIGGFNDFDSAYNVGILITFGVNDNFIAGGEVIEVAEDFAVDVVMSGEDQIAILAGNGGADMLANPFFKGFPIIPLDDWFIDVEGGDLDTTGLFRSGGGDGGWGVGVNDREKVARDVTRFAWFRRTAIDRRLVTTGEDNDIHEWCGGDGRGGRDRGWGLVGEGGRVLI